MGINDLRGELVLTMQDGYRLMPVPFSIPYGTALQQLEDELRRSFRIKEIDYETQLAMKDREIAVLKSINRPWYKRFFGMFLNV